MCETNGELSKDGEAAQESFKDIGIADEVIRSDETAVVRSLLAMISQMSRLLRFLSKVAEMLTMLLLWSLSKMVRTLTKAPRLLRRLSMGVGLLVKLWIVTRLLREIFS